MKELLDMNRIPQHIAIIMDGNGRFQLRRKIPHTIYFLDRELESPCRRGGGIDGTRADLA